MNARELLIKVLRGHQMLVGEVRAADVRQMGITDVKSGKASSFWVITYFVELIREADFVMAKIKRWIPATVENPASTPTGVDKGKCYAFEVTKTEPKNGFLEARLANVEPALIDPEGGALPVDAPSGADTGSGPNLVTLQTTPRNP